MKKQNDIVHEGVINAVRNGVAFVSIERSGGCAGCHARKSCGASDEKQTGIIDVPLAASSFVTGQKVNVHISRSTAFRAIIFAYFLPFLVLVSTILILISSGVSEPAAGLISIAALIPYFLLLWHFNNRLNKRISFYMTRL